MSNSPGSRVARPHDLESLESRRLMSVTLEDGVVSVIGRPDSDHISIHLGDGSMLNVFHNWDRISDGGWWRGEVGRFPLSEVKSIRIDAGGGDDYVMAHAAEFYGESFHIPMLISGGAGNDILLGAAAADTIIGGAGDDWIDGDGASNGLDYLLFRYSNGIPDERMPDFQQAALTKKQPGDQLYADEKPAPPPVDGSTQTAARKRSHRQFRKDWLASPKRKAEKAPRLPLPFLSRPAPVPARALYDSGDGGSVFDEMRSRLRR